MECQECDRLIDIAAGAHQDAAELYAEIRGGAYADDPEGRKKEIRGVEVRMKHVHTQLQLHQLGCPAALARLVAIPSMTIGTILSQFKDMKDHVR
jgi:hypothetical protein